MISFRVWCVPLCMLLCTSVLSERTRGIQGAEVPLARKALAPIK